MKTNIVTVVLCLSATAMLFTGCQTSSSNKPALTDEKSRLSYAVGLMYGSRWKLQGIEVNDSLIRGLKDGQSGGPALMTQQEMRDTLNKFQQEMPARNKAAGEAFLAKNKNQPGVVTLPDGLQYKVITDGNGPAPKAGDIVTVNYRGTFIDGTEFDNSARNGRPAQFQLGSVIRGWTEALTRMKVGSKWQLFVPAELAYGARGRPNIPPNSVLIFEIELLSIQSPPPPPPPAVSTNPPLTSDIIKVPSLDEMKKGAKVEIIKPEDVQKLQQSQPQKPQ
jgi:FKBP-type peptidyl-prolyl cis-trans isomerase